MCVGRETTITEEIGFKFNNILYLKAAGMRECKIFGAWYLRAAIKCSQDGALGLLAVVGEVLL